MRRTAGRIVRHLHQKPNVRPPPSHTRDERTRTYHLVVDFDTRQKLAALTTVTFWCVADLDSIWSQPKPLTARWRSTVHIELRPVASIPAVHVWFSRRSPCGLKRAIAYNAGAEEYSWSAGWFVHISWWPGLLMISGLDRAPVECDRWCLS
jgi:hypothetical protein